MIIATNLQNVPHSGWWFSFPSHELAENLSVVWLNDETLSWRNKILSHLIFINLLHSKNLYSEISQCNKVSIRLSLVLLCICSTVAMM